MQIRYKHLKQFYRQSFFLVIDGGNIVIGEIGLPNSYTTQSFIVMTDKVMRENEGLSQKEIETQIQDSFKPKECNSDYDITIVWLPWDPKDILAYGWNPKICRYK